MKVITFKLILLILLLTACSNNGRLLNMDFGEPQVRNRIIQNETPLTHNYLTKVKPVIENRCVVCHACYDAPCQLKLSSAEGIDRGFSSEQIYDSRISKVEPTRLFIDAKNTQEWRTKNDAFQPVLNERDQTPTANLQGSVLYKMLKQKNNHPLPQGVAVLSDDDFDFSLDREQTCTSIEDYDKYKHNFPLAGMPYGLPGINKTEFKVLENWIKQGAIMAQPPQLSNAVNQKVIEWEALFNGADNKSRLINRYIYEHLFLGHLYFSEINVAKNGLPDYFRLVRSTTPTGQAIDEIASRRPYDKPGVDTVYYRLRRETGTVVTKTHLPYALNSERKALWNKLFYKKSFTVNRLPSYDEGSNPFTIFVDLPADSRYRFMLDEARFTIDGFIKGPVCRGQIALSVIQDKFWAFFTNPDYLSEKSYGEFIYQQAENLELPSDYGVNHLAIPTWRRYQKKEAAYLLAQQDFLKTIDSSLYLGKPGLWKGNDNAGLTIFRNFDSAVVLKGLQGDTPKTAWIINYPILERIHYLLVAGFDIYGSIDHQLTTRLYMDFLRMEAELDFLTLLPQEKRRDEFKSWYVDSTDMLENYIDSDHYYFKLKNSIQYKTDTPKQEILTILKEVYNGFSKQNREVLKGNLAELSALPNIAVQQLAQTSFIMIEDETGNKSSYTLLRHNYHSNVASLFKEDDALRPEQDSAEIFNGFIGSYPQVIFYLKASQQQEFIEQFKQVNNGQSYKALVDNFAVRRTNPDFWQISDQVHQLHRKDNGVIYGLFDYNRFENR